MHEGPIGIGTRVQFSEVALAAGNVISNEPGFYEDGSFGIRIENIVVVKEVKTKHAFGDKPWLGFEVSIGRVDAGGWVQRPAVDVFPVFSS